MVKTGGEFDWDVLTVNATALLAAPPTVTTTAPVVAPVGTGTTMLVFDQLVGAAAVPLNVTVLVPCGDPKFAPVIVTAVPEEPLVGERLAIDGLVVAATVTDTSVEYALVEPLVSYARTEK